MKYQGFKYKDGSDVDLKFLSKKISKSIDKKAYGVYVKNTHNLYKQFLALSIHVLHDEFGFGDTRLTRYKEKMIKQMEMIADEYVDWSEFYGNIKMIEK